MDLRKNIPAQNEIQSTQRELDSPLVAISKAIGGFFAVIFGLFFMLMIWAGLRSPDNPAPQSTQPQQVAENKPQPTQPQQVAENKPQPTQPQQKPAASNTQSNGKPTKNTPKPAPKPVSPPPVSKPAVAAASAGKKSSWLKSVGKIGIGIITKGKVKIK